MPQDGLGSVWGRFGMVSGWFWDDFGMFWGGFGGVPGVFRKTIEFFLFCFFFSERSDWPSSQSGPARLGWTRLYVMKTGNLST